MAPHDRRGFLRGLASLPLIGGSVALISSPTEAAVPATDALLKRYARFAYHEYESAMIEVCIREGVSGEVCYERLKGMAPPLWIPFDRALLPVITGADPSARAAVVLSAAGVPLA